MKKLFFSSIFLCSTMLLMAESVGIFAPGSILSKKEISNGFQGESSFQGKSIKVYPSMKAFKKATFKGATVDYLIAPSTYFESSSYYTPVLQFKSDNADTYQYSLVAISPKWTASNTADGRVAIVEELGRKGMKTFVSKIMGGLKFKSINAVNGPKSLVSELGLDNVDYVLVRKSNLGLLKEKFGADIKVLMESSKIKHLMLGVKQGTSTAKAKEFLSLSKNALSTIDYSAVSSCEGRCQ